jgi:SAM-dependent methyltransferase
MDRLIEATRKAEQHHFWFRGFVRFTDPLIATAVRGVHRPRILDCGCGTGANVRRLSRHGDTTGFDLTWIGLEYAHHDGLRKLAQASILEIPFRTGSFDLVTAFDVLACLEAPAEARALSEMHRVLKPGGALLVNTAALPLLRGNHAVFGAEVRRTTRPLLSAALERAGFRVERLTYTNFSLFPLMLAVRLGQRLIGLSSPEEGGSDITVPPAAVNATLTAMLHMEALALSHLNMPIGSSLLGLARRI